jgi:hypothetical protein
VPLQKSENMSIEGGPIPMEVEDPLEMNDYFLQKSESRTCIYNNSSKIVENVEKEKIEENKDSKANKIEEIPPKYMAKISNREIHQQFLKDHIERKESPFNNIIIYSEELDALLCQNCIVYGIPKKTTFANTSSGCKTFTLDALKDHFKSKTHIMARKSFINVQTQENLGRYINMQNVKPPPEFAHHAPTQDLVNLFNGVYFLSKEEIAIRKIKSVSTLLKKCNAIEPKN